jgi:hypothetical protein
MLDEPMLGACLALNLSIVLGLRWTGNYSWTRACQHTLYGWIGVLVLFALRMRPLRGGLLDWFGAHALLMAVLMVVVTSALHLVAVQPPRCEEGTGLSPAEGT